MLLELFALPQVPMLDPQHQDMDMECGHFIIDQKHETFAENNLHMTLGYVLV